MTEKISVWNKIRRDLNVPKDRMGAFKNPYRNCDDIYDRLMPLVLREDCRIEYELETVPPTENGNMYFITVIAFLKNSENEIIGKAKGIAAVNLSKVADVSQAIGSATTYATKMALNFLFSIGSAGIDPDDLRPSEYEEISKKIKNARTLEELDSVAVEAAKAPKGDHGRLRVVYSEKKTELATKKTAREPQTPQLNMSLDELPGINLSVEE